MPFLENVLRGKNVPRERMLEVSEHYRHFGGVSPINQQCRDLIEAIKADFEKHNFDMPIYWGNRNWHPMIPDTLRQMKEDGVKNALAFFTSIYSCYSGCRQYRENILDAQAGLGTEAPDVKKLRMPFNHPDYVAASIDRVRDALDQIPPDRHSSTRFVFTAHSIPMSMADNCNYTKQLTESCRLVMDAFGDQSWDLVFQSRSGPPSQPWLEPDICDHLESIKAETGTEDVIIMPIGFVSDHMEVLFDLDTEAKDKCDDLGLNMVRAKTVGVHPKFVGMVRNLMLERMKGSEKLVVGDLPPSHDVCPVDCCKYEPRRRPTQPAQAE